MEGNSTGNRWEPALATFFPKFKAEDPGGQPDPGGISA